MLFVHSQRIKCKFKNQIQIIIWFYKIFQRIFEITIQNSLKSTHFNSPFSQQLCEAEILQFCESTLSVSIIATETYLNPY